jgi:beta-glucosidase
MMDYDIRRGRTYMYFRDKPLYPFGYGLSYTTFDYRDLRTSASYLSSTGEIEISVAVRNTGRRTGEEVVQLYVTHLNSTVARPLKELKAFTRVHLAPQEEKIVKLTLPAARLAYWNAEMDRWVVEKDEIDIVVGGSSSDAKLRKKIRVR